MKLANSIQEHRDLQHWFDQQLSELPYPDSARNRLACACFDMVLEHYKAITELVYLRLPGSAFSLSRSLFESCVRGIWLHRCATENEISRYERDKFGKRMHELITDIEHTEGFESKTFSKTQGQTWGTLNSLTHSGYEQLGRRFNGNIQEPSYAESDQMIILNHAKALALITVYMISLVSENTELQKAVDAKVEQGI
jgi:hypothetical protein